MAYLMTDMAAGSDAALTMQRNMAAAPDVKQAQSNFMQEQQLKIQKEQADVEKARLSNMVAESGFQTTQDSKAKLQALLKTPKWAAADDAERLRMSAAVQLETGDIEGGAKTLAASEIFDAKKAAAEQKKLDIQAQVIGNAYGVLESVPDDKVGEFFARMPKPQQDALVSQIGKENWESMTGAEKKEAAKNLMMNAKGQLAQQKWLADLTRQNAINTSREKVAEITGNARIAAKTAGTGAGTSKADLEALKVFQAQHQKDQVAYKSQQTVLVAAYEEAQKEVDKDRLFGNLFSAKDDAISKRDAVGKRIKEFEIKQLKRDVETASLLPPGPTRTNIMQELKRRGSLLGLDDKQDTPSTEGSTSGIEGDRGLDMSKVTPEQKKRMEAEDPEAMARGIAKFEASKTTPTDVPSNKGEEEIKKKVEASGQKYEPSKYMYRIAPDGSVQRKAK